ncbi:hypothetical protein STAS_02158 [Striga asiatica]|uniref:KIB1-4 beta-propeller domain-containing protein n=1 Tax=Striga asiatica TaxID=4170 RepID=A0A5A7P150_STRAF|nr:hypothetical protein STAS_02158 [Striga asiatica]
MSSAAAAAAPSRVVKSPPWMMVPPSFEGGRMVNYNFYSLGHDRNLFFCLTEIDCDDLEAWDLTDPTLPRLVWWNHKDLLGPENYIAWLDDVENLRMSKTGIWTRPLRYLVYAEDLRQLFLVTRHLVEQMAPDGSSVEDLDRDDYPYKTVAFDVHKIDREEGGGGKLSYVGGSLGGLSMFVGHNHSFAVMPTNGGLKPDSIYFTEDREFCPGNSNFGEDEETIYGGHDIGIYDYEKKTISPCYYPCDVGSLKRIVPSPIWFTPSTPS